MPEGTVPPLRWCGHSKGSEKWKVTSDKSVDNSLVTDHSSRITVVMKRREFIFQIVGPLAVAGLSARRAVAQARVYLTESQALQVVFQKSRNVRSEEKTLTAEQKNTVEQKLRYRLATDTYKIYIGETSGAADGYAMILNEIGKEEPITFIVGVTPQFRVKTVALMVFRESRGWEVEDSRFTGQFRGKSPKDAVQLNADIIGVTGATLSSRAFCKGVKKTLVLCETFYRK